MTTVDDVRDQIEIDEKVARYQCYEQKSALGCETLGYLLEFVHKKSEKAAQVYKFSCDKLKHGTSCFKYGMYPLTGTGVPKNLDEGFQYEVKGCEYGNGKACLAVGNLYMGRGEEKFKDPTKGLEFFKKGCDLKQGESCFSAASCYNFGLPGLPADVKKVFQYTSAGCEANHALSCLSMSLMYENGYGVDKDLKMAAKCKEKAKDLGSA